MPYLVPECLDAVLHSMVAVMLRCCIIKVRLLKLREVPLPRLLLQVHGAM
jgi:hypothetical protein